MFFLIYTINDTQITAKTKWLSIIFQPQQNIVRFKTAIRALANRKV